MIRIGRQIPHFKEVNPLSIEAIFSEDKRFRYLLKMRYASSLYDTERSKMAAVVLKNPSAADTKAADSTIRKVETFIYHHLKDVVELCILNIFALRATDALDLNSEFVLKGPESIIGVDNDSVIQTITGEADYVVAAWGNRSGIQSTLYEERVRKVKHLLMGTPKHMVFEVKGGQDTVQPLHGMMWGYDHQLIPYLNLKGE